MLSFFDEVKRIASDEYIPTEADVLRARTKTRYVDWGEKFITVKISYLGT